MSRTTSESFPWEHENWPDSATHVGWPEELIELDRQPDQYFIDRRQHRPYVAKGPIEPARFYEIGRLLIDAYYQFARTMPTNPHWYTLRRQWSHLGVGYNRIFTDVNRAVREHGYTEYFNRIPWRMLNVNGWKYWNYYSSRVEEVVVLNRRPIYGVTDPFDALADGYDDVLGDPVSRKENDDVIDLLGDLRGLNVLDVGCGTGLLLDYLHGQMDPSRYTGIDPSERMLERLIDKHPTFAGSVMRAKFEEFVPMTGPYDLVVSLFGSPGYIDPVWLEQIPLMVKPGGRWVVMFLAEGYSPVTYDRLGVSVPVQTGVLVDLPGERSTIGNFVVIDGLRPLGGPG